MSLVLYDPDSGGVGVGGVYAGPLTAAKVG